tara:strand:+ start:286 stop:585 length:300 start_codon:yes stop_codon:yes gene_type:complete
MGIVFAVGCEKGSGCEAYCDNVISQGESCSGGEASYTVETCTSECEANFESATEGCSSEADAVLACGSEATIDCETGLFCEEEFAELEECQYPAEPDSD